MIFTKLKKVFVRGIALALPLVVVGYILNKAIEVFEKLVSPIAHQFGVEKIFGEITVTILAILVLALLILLLGLLMYLPVISRYKNYLEEWILKIFPSLNHLKLMAEDKLNLESATTKWRPVFVNKDNQYWPAYIIEEDNEWITLAQVKTPSTEPGNMLIIRKDLINCSPITMEQMHHYNKEFGKGYLSLVNKRVANN
jgi:hypothetical protein